MISYWCYWLFLYGIDQSKLMLVYPNNTRKCGAEGLSKYKKCISFLLLFILRQELQKRKKPPLYTSSSTIIMAKSTPISTLTTNTLPSTTSIVSFSSIMITSAVNIAATPSALLSSREHVTVHTTTTEANDSRVKAVNTLQVEQVVSTAKSEVGSLGISGTLFVWFLFLQGINTSLP